MIAAGWKYHHVVILCQEFLTATIYPTLRKEQSTKKMATKPPMMEVTSNKTHY